MDRRKRKTQALLKETLLTLLQHQTFDSITIRQLCDRADLNRSTFYLNYQDKYDLLAQIIRGEILQLVQACHQQPATEQLNTTFHYLTQHRQQFRCLLQADDHGVFAATFGQYLTTHLSQKRTLSRLEQAFFVGGIIAALRTYLLEPNMAITELDQVAQLLQQAQ